MRLVLQGRALTNKSAHVMANLMAGELITGKSYSTILLSKLITDDALWSLRKDAQFDVNYLPSCFDASAIKLVVIDMDSTLIAIECIDEIAAFNGKSEVADITNAAMLGEIDFATSLRERVSLLRGVDVSMLEYIYNHRLKLNPGADLMLRSLRKHGIKVALASGGFTFFTERLKQRLGLDYAIANVLGEHNGKLTGDIVGDICDAQAKANFLLSCCKKLAILPSQVLAIGDGANDVPMMQAAGLSVAYHAKPCVQTKAMTVINYCGLDGVLGLLQI